MKPTTRHEAASIESTLNWLRRNAGTTVLLVFSAGLIGWMVWPDTQEPLVPPRFTSVVRGDIEVAVSAVGIIEPLRLMEVGAQVSGQLNKVHVKLGDVVSQGDLLAEMDDSIQVSHVSSAQANLAALEARTALEQANLELAQSDLQRQERLMQARATTEIELERARVQVAQAEVAVETQTLHIEQAQALLDEARALLKLTRIWAPVDGTIVKVLAQEGQTLNAGQSTPIILEIGDLRTVAVNAKIAEVDMERLTQGMEAYVTTLSGGVRRWQTRLKEISPLPSPGGLGELVYFDALLEVDNADAALLPGISARVFFLEAAARDVLKVPLGATDTFSDLSTARVRVILPDGGVEAREIQVGLRNAIEVEVLGGLREDDRIVLE